MLNPHVAMIEGWLVVEPQLTALAIGDASRRARIAAASASSLATRSVCQHADQVSLTCGGHDPSGSCQSLRRKAEQRVICLIAAPPLAHQGERLYGTEGQLGSYPPGFWRFASVPQTYSCGTINFDNYLIILATPAGLEPATP